MTIIGLQRRLVQVGRIRMGEKVSGTGRPTRLEKWRLTSRDQVRLEAAAEAFGGKVRPWEQRAGEYELYTETDTLPVLLMPNQTISQHYELWSGGGCKRRCDGETEQLSDAPCLCDPENRECKPTTRLNVLLPDVPGIGCWRLDSTGYYAATELAGAVDLLELATSHGVLLPARLRIDQRSSLKDGQTKRYGVPTLDIDVRPLEMHAIARQAAEGEIAAGTDQPLTYTPVAALTPGVSLEEGLAAANGQTERREHARSSAPIGEASEFEGEGVLLALEEPIPVPEDSGMTEAVTTQTGAGQRDVPAQAAASDEPEPGTLASTEQQRLLMATAREAGVSDARRYDLTEQICGEGIRSVKRVPKDKVDQLLAALSEPANLSIPELIGKIRDYGNALGIIDAVNAKFEEQHEAANATELDVTGENMRPWLEKQLARLKERYEASQP